MLVHGCALLVALTACRRPVEEVFRLSTDAPTRAGLVVAGGCLLLANSAGALSCLEESGAVRWQVKLQREIAATPVAVGELAIAATVDGEWVGVRLASGEVLWRVSDGPPTLTPLVTDGARVFAVAEDGAVHALQPASGNPYWVRRPPKRHVSSAIARPLPAPVISGERVIVSLEDSGLFALMREDGAVAWRKELTQVVGLAASERVFVSLKNGAVVALESATGGEVWEARLGREATSAPSLIAGRVYVGGGDSELVALSPDDGRVQVRVSLPGPLVTGVSEAAGWLLVPTAGARGELLALDPSSHQVRFRLRLDTPLRTAAHIRGERAFVFARDGRAFGFQLRPPER